MIVEILPVMYGSRKSFPNAISQKFSGGGGFPGLPADHPTVKNESPEPNNKSPPITQIDRLGNKQKIRRAKPYVCDQISI